MTRRSRTRWTALRTTTIAAAAAIMVITGCAADGRGSTGGLGGQGAQPERQLPALQLASSLRRLDSCDDVRTWAHDELAPRVGAYGFPGGDGGAPTFSGTNVQVDGVDEPDIVKTDGERILTVANGRLHLASAGRNRIVDSLALPESMYDAQLLLAGDRAIVFGSADYGMPIPLAEEVNGGGATQPPPGPKPQPQPSIPSTRVVQVDIDG